MTTRRYPPTPRQDVVDNYHGHLVKDPYRWLEDVDSPETRGWISAQNSVTSSFLASVGSRDQIRRRLSALWDYPRFGVPFERGGRWFQTRNTGLQDQPVLYVAGAPDEEGRPLLDPNNLSPDGTVAVTSRAVDERGSLLAYATSQAGSDWRTWRLRDVDTGYDLDDVVEWSKFSGAAWSRDGSGFYYSAMPAPQPGRELAQENRCPQIRFHRIGTSQDDDAVVFVAPDQPEWLPDAAVSDDDRYLILSIQRGTNPENVVLVLDREHPDTGFQTLVGDFDAKAVVVANVGSTFVVLTDEGAPRGRMVSIALGTLDRSQWQEILPEQSDTLIEAHPCGGKLVCHYLRDAHSVLQVHELDGRYLWDIPLPGLVAVAGSRPEEKGIEGRPDRDVLHFRVTSFSDSGALWSHHVGTGETRLLRGSTADLDPDDYLTEQVFATSDDGTLVPMFLSRRRHVTPTGDVPVLLYGYGGFDVPVTPTFSVPAAVWMERGGVYVVVNLRGGGEYGREWHDAGRLANKQHVFDDFCAGARWLSESGWTTADRTAIYGGSNGGLLVGACLTQHPELFGAAVSDVGVFDMLRFHRFTIGWAWTSDYGSPDDPEQFAWLRAYSPLHNVHSGWCYPATMVFTGDHDDRVVPGHSFKFAATLQAAQACDRPVLLRVEASAGHGQGKPVSKLIAESTDRLAFLDAVLGSSAH